MPELGPYGSMRGEVRENLPYRDFGTRKVSAATRLDRKGRPGVTPNGFFMRLPVTGSVDIK